MCDTTLEKRTVKIVAKMFSWKTFDITKLDTYFLTHTVDKELLYSLYEYIDKHIGSDTFIFTDVFDMEFQKLKIKEK